MVAAKPKGCCCERADRAPLLIASHTSHCGARTEMACVNYASCLSKLSGRSAYSAKGHTANIHAGHPGPTCMLHDSYRTQPACSKVLRPWRVSEINSPSAGSIQLSAAEAQRRQQTELLPAPGPGCSCGARSRGQACTHRCGVRCCHHWLRHGGPDHRHPACCPGCQSGSPRKVRSSPLRVVILQFSPWPCSNERVSICAVRQHGVHSAAQHLQWGSGNGLHQDGTPNVHRACCTWPPPSGGSLQLLTCCSHSSKSIECS